MSQRIAGILVYASAFAAFVLLGHLLAVTLATPVQAFPNESPAPNHALERMLLPGSSDLQLIVELSSPPVVDMMLADRGLAPTGTAPAELQRSRLELNGAQASAYRAGLATEQRGFADRISRIPGARVEAHVDTVLNALIVRVPPEEFQSVNSLPGVKRVYFSRPFRMLLDTSAQLLNAQPMWNRSGGRDRAGKGIKIGIIDTGIDITNPMFTDDSLVAPSGYPRGESGFTNSKVIVARNYINLLPVPQTVQSALDEVGHGSFVGGAAAGRLVDAPLAKISGMAPGAFLGSYKVFGTPGLNDFTTTAALLAAINDAVADGMDVLNLSLGSLNYLPPSEDPEIGALEKAIRAGIVVVAAAGNEGPQTRTIENPGSAPDVISVGSVTNSRTFASHIHVTAPVPFPADLESMAYLSGDGPPINDAIPPSKVIDVARLDGTGEACSQLPSGSLKGSIALVLRKPCTFAAKVANAQAAGAFAVIVYNNNPAEGPIPMAGLGSTDIPAVMVSNAGGLGLKEFVAANPDRVQVAIDNKHMLTAAPIAADVLSSFSSVGPGTDFSIKPDMVAVGENVYSAAQAADPKGVIYSPDGFVLGAGTSFSAPMVAGAAAGLRQLFPQLDSFSIKSALVNTASLTLTLDGTHPPDVMQAGGGLLDMGAASVVGAVFSPPSLNFGAQSYEGSLSLSRTVTIRNIASVTDQYVLNVQPVVAGAAASLSRSGTGSVPPGGTADVTLTLQVTAPQSGGFQGRITILSTATGSQYHIAYWAGLYVRDRSRILTVTRNSGVEGSFGNLTDALNAAQPGNIIEIADSATYPAGFTINTNAQGLPLDGITIRAAAGQSPTLDGSSAFGAPGNIRIAGLRSVLIQGLKISGGITGMLLTQSSTSSPLTVTVDHCTIDATSGAGIVVFSGAAVEVTNSVISNSQGTGIVAIGGALTLAGSTVQNNAADGIDALGVNVDILDSTVTGNAGPGLNSVGSSGTIADSTFSLNHGRTGDGIEIVDGSLTMTGNSFESNDRAGIAFFAGGGSGTGPVARAAGNIIRDNHIYGVLASAGQALLLDGNLIKDNAAGFVATGFAEATLANNIIVRSTDAMAGNGIRVADKSSVRAVNNTIFNNALHGMAVEPTASAKVYNTIIGGSGSSDVQGLTIDSISFSLVRDGSIVGNGNFSGDPRFVDPDKDDFSLLSDSPAIGAGTNAAPDLPFLDFSGHLRVSAGFAGGLTATGTVDVGAAETSSLYPLTFPLLANGEQPELGGNVTTGIAILNGGSASGTIDLACFSPTGRLLEAESDPATERMEPAAQIPRLGFQLFGFDSEEPVLGSILAGSTEPLAGFLLLFDSDFNRFATGVSVSGDTAGDLVFMRHLSDMTGRASYVLFNPGATAATIKATLFSATGKAGDVKTATLAPKGQYIFGYDNATGSSGYARVTSDRPVSGLEVFGNAENLTALPGITPSTEARLFFPHIAFSEGFSTQIGIINSAANPANLALTAYDDDGNVIGTPALVNLNGNSQILEDVAGFFDLKAGLLRTGYVIAQGDVAGIMGFAAFTYASGTRRVTAALPADSIPRRHQLFSHVAHQVPAARGGTYQTGVGLLNPFGAAQNYTISVYDGAGTLVARESGSLEPHQKTAKLLSHPTAGVGFFEEQMHLSSGHVEVTSDLGLFGVELFFTEDFSQLAAVAAQIPPTAR